MITLGILQVAAASDLFRHSNFDGTTNFPELQHDNEHVDLLEHEIGAPHKSAGSIRISPNISQDFAGFQISVLSIGFYTKTSA